MAFWKPTQTKKREPRPPDTGKAIPAKKKIHRSPPIAFEAKILAIEAVNSGADRLDISEVLGVRPTTLKKWMKVHREEGLSGLCRKPSSVAVRKQCTELEKRIIAHRLEHPERGVRRSSTPRWSGDRGRLKG